jgi:hypothetical protein
MPFFFAVVEIFPYLLVLWILSVSAALYHVRTQIPVSKAEAVLTQPGYAIDRKLAWGYELLIASVAGDLFAALVIELGIIWNYGDLPFLHLLSLGFLGIAAVAFWMAHGYYLEIKQAQRIWEFADDCATLKEAGLGKLVIGYQFEHEIASRVQKPSDSLNALPGEVITETILQRLGSKGAYLIDLANERNPHVVVLGTSGIGKTETVKTLVLRNWLAKGIPSLIIDWTNQYPDFTRDIGGVVWTVPLDFTINPLKLLGLSPSERVEEVEEALFFSLGLTSLQATEVGKTILEEYKRAGIVESDPSTWSLPTPTISDIVDVMRTRAETGYYKGEIHLSSVNSTLDKFHPVMRIFGKEETDFFETVLRIPTCIDLSSLSDLAKAQVSYTVLQRIYRQFSKLGHAKLRLLTILDEAQLILAVRETTGLVTQKPLPVKIVEEGRKYGFGVVVSTHQASTVPEEIRTNAATIILLSLDEVDQVRYLRRWLNLSQPELEAYAELPLGGCFVKHNRERYSTLVRVQMASQAEFEAAKTKSSRVAIPKTRPSVPTISRPAEKTRTEPEMTAEEKLLQWLNATEKKLPVSPPEEASVVSPPIPPDLSPLGSKPVKELTPDETRILNVLSSGPVTMRDLSSKFPRMDYRKILDVIEDLSEQDLIQAERVVNLERSSTIYYAALRDEWVKSEGIEHRAILDMIEKALVNLRPVPYGATNPNHPDVGLEKSAPRTCIEVETGRKKLTREELERWAKNVNERDRKLGYEIIVVVVPSVEVERRYSDACKRNNLKLTTMTNFLANLNVKT